MGHLGGLLGRLELTEARKGENANTLRTRKEHLMIFSSGPTRGSLGSVLGRLEGLLSRRHKAILGRFAQSWDVLEAS